LRIGHVIDSKLGRPFAGGNARIATRFGELLFSEVALTSFFNRFEHLFDDLRVQYCAPGNWDSFSSGTRRSRPWIRPARSRGRGRLRSRNARAYSSGNSVREYDHIFRDPGT
jgi:hypothetical protein